MATDQPARTGHRILREKVLKNRLHDGKFPLPTPNHKPPVALPLSHPDLTGNTLGGNTSTMKVTVKGQITIPLALRERFGLGPGTEVEFVATGGVLQVKPRKQARKAARPFDHWLAKAAGSAKPGMTTDEMMTITRGED
jgi:AbrB family looped-hinge helix DNA binding protein